MDNEILYQILRETTLPRAKRSHSPRLKTQEYGPLTVVEVDMRLSDEDPVPDGTELVDLHYLCIAVDRDKAQAHYDGLVAWLNDYPKPEELDTLTTFRTMTETIEHPMAVLALFAIGKVLGFWDVLTPESVGLSGATACEVAHAGGIMKTRWVR